MSGVEERISESERLLKSLGYSLPDLLVPQGVNNTLEYTVTDAGRLLARSVLDAGCLKADSLAGVSEVALTWERKNIIIPTWEEMCVEVERVVGNDTKLELLFSMEELQANERTVNVKLLNEEFNTVYRINKYDVTISVVAGVLVAVIDILLAGVPRKTLDENKADLLPDYVCQWFDER